MSIYEDMMQQLKGEMQNQTSQSSYWKRYDDTVSAMSQEQRAWVGKQVDVIDAKNAMFSVFFDYLFEMNKDAFVSVGDGKYKGVVDNYIDMLQKTANNYVSRAEALEKENEELRNKLKIILEDRLNDKSMATNGIGPGGASSNSEIVRTGDNTKDSDGDLPLFGD